MNLLEWGNQLWEQIAAQHFSEWAAVVGAILYLLLAARENPWCWFWGIISCVFWAYAAFVRYELYVDGILQLFYVAISFWGIYEWLYGQKGKEPLTITTFSRRQHLFIISGGLVLSFLTGYLFDEYTPAAATYLDAFTTIFSVIITLMVIYKKLENWLYWMVIDSVYVYLYWSRGGYLISLLFIVYLVIVVVGYLNWRRQYQATLLEKA